MARNNFGRCNALGQGAEKRVGELLHAAGLVVRYAREDSSLKKRFSDWDVVSELAGKPVTFEVKLDLEEARTGNLAVEVYNCRSCVPSGLSATRADVWVFVLASGQVWAASVARLREHVEQNKPLRTVTAAGDGNATVKLYPSGNLLRAVFSRLDACPASEVPTLLAGLLSSNGG